MSFRYVFFFFSSRRRHTRSCLVSWARRCVQETGVNMARDTYLSKIILRKDHLAPTLSLGISINHVVSMSIPALGGLMWIRYGHSSVFLATAGIAILMGLFSALVRTPSSTGAR
eukprot:TRINITY_DN17357_c0_g1_i2.p4 TRINITY_DN17357_c0_g1~~TRINITY_DN17357_c0_g1_i2.p4  ORF type:complete len:114 (+),score=10.09 TRINITY_DN17357_c0_g1_i2:47-388(+)